MGIWQITLTGLLTGVIGTTLGAIVVLLLGRPQNTIMSALLGFAGGIMVSIVFFELLPEAFEIGGFLPGFIGLVLGIGLIMALDAILPHTHFFDAAEASNRFIKAGAILGIGVALHNLPEGLAIGAGYAADMELGIMLAMAMLLHNVPEGMALSAPMYAGGLCKKKIIGFTMLTGLPMGVGALIGAAVSGLSPLVLSVGLGFAAGAMIFITFDELIPGAHELSKGYYPAFGSLAGILLGIIIGSFH